MRHRGKDNTKKRGAKGLCLQTESLQWFPHPLPSVPGPALCPEDTGSSLEARLLQVGSTCELATPSQLSHGAWTARVQFWPWSQAVQILTQTLTLTSEFGHLPSLLVPQFPHLWIRILVSTS